MNKSKCFALSFILICPSCLNNNALKQEELQSPPLYIPIDKSSGAHKLTTQVYFSKDGTWGIGINFYLSPRSKIPFLRRSQPTQSEFNRIYKMLGSETLYDKGVPAKFIVAITDINSHKIIFQNSIEYPKTFSIYAGRAASLFVFSIKKGTYNIDINYELLSKDLNNLYPEVYINNPYNGK